MRCEVCRAFVCASCYAGFTHSRSYCLNGTRGSDTYAGQIPRTHAGPETPSEPVPAAGFAPDVAPPVTC